jgi:hypothetical protein
MPTVNLNVTESWTKIADATHLTVLVTSRSIYTIEVAVTAADSAPEVLGHLLHDGDAITRDIVGPGFLWARVSDGRHVAGSAFVLAVSK